MLTWDDISVWLPTVIVVVGGPGNKARSAALERIQHLDARRGRALTALGVAAHAFELDLPPTSAEGCQTDGLRIRGGCRNAMEAILELAAIAAELEVVGRDLP